MIWTIVALVLLVPVGVATAILLVELWLGLMPGRRRAEPLVELHQIAVIIPARDEAATIAASIAPLVGMRLLVVADNCADDSAAIARAAGAEVIERDDRAHQGKGYALACARDHFAANPPDVAIVIDADCVTDIASIRALAGAAIASGRPAQAAYLMRPRRDRGAIVALSGFAFLVKNLIRQRGIDRLGGPAILTGSGMAFPWPLFARAPLATGETVEDLALGITFTRAGTPPLFLQQAVVWTEAAGRKDTLDQRRRWEHGFLATAFSEAPRLICSGKRSQILLGLHLLVPPLALLVLWHAGLMAWLSLMPAPHGFWLIEAALAVALLSTLAACWIGHGRAWLSPSMLAAIPFYIMRKVPIYMGALLGRKRSWNRTGRS